MNVVEDVVLIGTSQPLRSVERDEQLLLAPPHRGKIPMKLWRDHPLLSVVHYPQEYEAQPFAPPRGIYENDQIRVEWQTMDNRQPFYHRNCDVDEISYQIAGERTLITELGVVEHRAGEFSRIPRGVAHDNYGRKESHLLFYIPAPVSETGSYSASSQPISPPFPGWEPGEVNEAVTQCMGALGHDITVFPVNEHQIIDHVKSTNDRIRVLRGSSELGTSWLYSAPGFRLGLTVVGDDDEPRYRRTLDADEIQYQVCGRRTLLTQRGIVDLQPGDFIRIPLGIAHRSVGDASAEYISLLSHLELPQVADTTRIADPYSPERLEAAYAKAH